MEEPDGVTDFPCLRIASKIVCDRSLHNNTYEQKVYRKDYEGCQNNPPGARSKRPGFKRAYYNSQESPLIPSELLFCLVLVEGVTDFR